MLIIHYFLTFMPAASGSGGKGQSERSGVRRLMKWIKGVFLRVCSRFAVHINFFIINYLTIAAIRRLLIRYSVGYNQPEKI